MPEPDLHPTPLLPQKELYDFAQSYFERKQIFQTAVENYGSPLWVIEPAVLKKNARRFSNALNQYFSNTSFYFAMKCNSHPLVSATLLESGFGLDVSSGEELKAALDIGACDIIFSGPGKTKHELALAFEHRHCTTLLLDSFGELDRLKQILSKTNAKNPIKVGVRLTTNPNGLWRKFGIPADQLPAFWEQIKSQSNIKFTGLQFHSSWNLTPERQVEFISALGLILKKMPGDFLNSMEFLDIGGGYWPESGEWLQFAGTSQGIIQKAMGNDSDPIDHFQHYRIPGMTIEDFACCLFKAVDHYIFPLVNCRICFEPGRWICHSAMHILFSVVDKKDHDLVVTDAGTNAIGWERFETDYFPVLNLSRSALDEKACHILGALCTPHDVWGYTYFGTDIQEGDLLMIPCQGAYTYSLGQRFIKPLPDVHAV